MEGNSFSASVSIYKKFDTVMGKDEDITKAPLRVNQGFFQSIPSSSGSIVRWRDYNLGLSIVVPDYETFKGDISTTTNNTSTLSYLDQSLWVGPTISKQINKQSSMGLTVYYTARSYTRSVQDRTIDTSTNSVTLFSEEKNIIGNGIVGILGYQYKLNRFFTAGLTIRGPIFEVAGSGTYFLANLSSTNGAFAAPISISNTTLKSHTLLPPKLTLGFAYRDNPWTVSIDGTIYGSVKYYDFDDETIQSHIQHNSMFNGALGVEYKVNRWLIGRAGWYTNLTSQKQIEESDKYGERVDQLGFAANLTFISKEQIKYTFGGYYVGGRGKSVQRINQEYTIVPEIAQVFTMLVGTSYFF
jgi:hypothetical protein